jgi:diacylglycerol O-acyltransferase
VVPLAADHAVGIAIFSYHGRLTFGVIGDADSTPDLGILAEGIAQGLTELRELAAAAVQDAPRRPDGVGARA